eukprot:366375-Chlamydomonas_euryale.AAC.2
MDIRAARAATGCIPDYPSFFRWQPGGASLAAPDFLPGGSHRPTDRHAGATSMPCTLAWLPASCSTLLVTMRIRAPPRPVSSSVSHTSANRLPKPLGAFTQGSKKSTGPVRSHPLTAIVTLAAPSSARVRFQGTCRRLGSR